MDQNSSTESERLYLEELGYHDLLDRDTEKELLERAKGGDTEARDQLILMNQRMVIGLAHRYMSMAGDLEFMDLIQSGNLGLMEAITRFDLSKDLRFSTYSFWWIRVAIQRACKSGIKISLSNYARDTMIKVSRAYEKLYGEKHRPPTQEEIADYLGIPLYRVQQVWSSFSGCASLDQVVHKDKTTGNCDVTLGELIPTESISPEEDYEKKEVFEKIKSALSEVEPHLSKVIIHRFGLDGSEPLTYQQIGDKLGMSRESIRRYEYLGTKKIHEALTKYAPNNYEDKTEKKERDHGSTN